MNRQWPAEGKIYTETIVHSAPERYIANAPYQLAVIEASNGERFTVRLALAEWQEAARIGDTARFLEEREGVAFYCRVFP